MTTAYTSILEEKDPTFEEFVLRCARSTGYLYFMRDEPLDKPLPEVVEPETSYKELIAKTRESLRKVCKMSQRECEEEAQKVYDEKVANSKGRLKKPHSLKDKYQKMIEKVENWVPPSVEHTGLKDFMLDQLRIDFKWMFGREDMMEGVVECQTAEEWRQQQIEMLEEDLDKYGKRYKKDVERACASTKYLQKLRESLK